MTGLLAALFSWGRMINLLTKCAKKSSALAILNDELIRQYATLYSQHLKDLGFPTNLFILGTSRILLFTVISTMNAIIKSRPELRTGLYIDSMPVH